MLTMFGRHKSTVQATCFTPVRKLLVLTEWVLPLKMRIAEKGEMIPQQKKVTFSDFIVFVLKSVAK
jgi:hypothetical protein